MSSPTTIDRAKKAVPGPDYETLRKEAIDLTQLMSHKGWTDYNYSDPGVTIVEQLCYALSEMPYRASFAVQDLLAPPVGEHVALRKHGLVPAMAILPCNPVTRDDFRRIVLDRVPEVANVWFTRCAGSEHRGLSGLYDVAILPRSDNPDTGEACCGQDELIERVLRCYRGHRSLCEDVHQAKVLDLIDTYVHAEVELEDGADPSDTLAQALFALGLFLAPEPRRRSLNEELVRDAATARVFAGPMMLRGFIADDQLLPLPHKVPVTQLLQILAETPGVLSVGRMSVETGERTHQRGDTIHVPKNGVLWLQGSNRDNHFTIHLHRNYARVKPNSARVARLLEKLWSAQRRTFAMRAEYTAHYGPPKGNFRDLAAYTSVQDQFPNLYGINPAGLPPGASPTRKGQAKQLKGYLMPFDQLMADYFAQLAFIRTLFSIDAGGDKTYATQSLATIVSKVSPLLMPDYKAGVAEVALEGDPVDTRRNGVLDLLLSLYAEQVDGPAGPGKGTDAGPQATTLIQAKQTMLKQVASLTRNRGRGADYRRSRSARGISGMERLCRLQLGLLDTITRETAARPGGDSRTERLWSASPDPAHANFGLLLPEEMGSALDSLFQPVSSFDLRDAPARPEPSPLAGHRVAQPLAEALGDPGRYRIGRSPGSMAIYIACVDAEGGWWWLGEHHDEARALETIRQLLRDSRHPHGGDDGHARFYVVDWVLLRHAGLIETDSSRYNFRVTALLSASRKEWEDTAWRHEAEWVIRDNTPAHIALDCLFLKPGEMLRFEKLHSEWLGTLRGCNTGRQIQASRALADFLDGEIPSHPRPTPTATPHPTNPYPHPTGTPEPAPTPCPMPTPEPTPCPAPTPPYPVPEPTPCPGPAPTPEPVPEPEPDEPEHPVWDWITWFWSAWVWPMIKLVVGWRLVLYFFPGTPEPTPLPLPAPEPTGAPVPPPPDDGGATPTPAPAPTPASGSGLPGHVAAAPSGALAFDTDTILTSTTARAFAEAGIKCAIRYLPRNALATPSAPQGDLTAPEAKAILDAGLALMPVQHVAGAGWVPSESLGTSYGQYAVQNAQAVGLPAGISVWLDLEGVAAGTPAGTIQDYCNAWYDQVAAAGYVPGLYVGANCGLTGTQIVGTAFRHFWQSGSSVPAISTGYCMVQKISGSYVIDGVSYDLDTIQTDEYGQTPVWLAPNGSTPAPAPAPAPTPTPTPAPTPAPATSVLGGTVRKSVPGTRGFDCNTVLTASSAQAFKNQGFAFAVRYVPRTFVATASNAQGNLTTAEAQHILGAGLALMAVQHVQSPGWVPSEALGTSYGQIAAANAQAVGLPPGINLWLDLEGVASGTAAGIVQDYCNAWYDEVAGAGYVPGLYVGASCGLSATQLVGMSFRYFWQSGSTVPALSTGYCLVQKISGSYVVDGIAYDLDTVQSDEYGQTPIWLAPSL